MSDENEDTPSVENNVEEEEIDLEKSEKLQKTKIKNPNRVKQGLKLAAIGQKAKEEKMRKRVQEEMYKPSTWIMVGVALTSIGFIGLYFSPLFPKSEEKIVYTPSPPSEIPKKNNKNYFG